VGERQHTSAFRCAGTKRISHGRCKAGAPHVSGLAVTPGYTPRALDRIFSRNRSGPARSLQSTRRRNPNSGHITIEAGTHSQFCPDRFGIVCGQPLGPRSGSWPSPDVNLLATRGSDSTYRANARPFRPSGPACYWYGSLVRPGRKLGHITWLKERTRHSDHARPPGALSRFFQGGRFLWPFVAKSLDDGDGCCVGDAFTFLIDSLSTWGLIVTVAVSGLVAGHVIPL